MAERTQDTLEHCRLMLLLLRLQPQSVDTHGVSIINCQSISIRASYLV